MAVAIYPIQNYSNEPRKLPYPVRDGFSEKYGQSFKAVQMDDSHNRMRRKFAMQPMDNTITWQFTWDQFLFFEAFLKYDCASASGYFQMPLYPGAALKTFRFKTYPDTDFSADKNCWTVTGQVEYIRSAPVGFDAKPPSLPVWPDSLGQPEKDSYKLSRPDQVTRSNTTAGLATERDRFNDDIVLVSCKWIFNSTQLATFESFAHDQLLGGLAPFRGYFANGKGINLTRCRFTSFAVAPSGINWEVTASMELQDFPQMSELIYRGYDHIALVDTVTYSTSVSAKFGANKTDSFGFADAIRFKVGKRFTETYGFSEDGPFMIAQYKRTLTDSVSFAEVRSFGLTLSPLNDTVRFSSLGEICTNDYISPDYIQAGYFADCAPFNVETQGYESFGMVELINIISNYHSQQNEALGIAATGAILNRQYIDLDYIEYDYTIDVIQTF